MDGEEIIDTIQVDAATDAAVRVAEVAHGATLVVAAEVAQVGDVLEQHAQTSEERHTEILEGQIWIKTQLELLSTTLQMLVTTQAATQAATLAAIQGVQTTVESMGTIPSTQSPPVELAVVEPVANVDDPPEAKTASEKPKPRRRII